MVFLQLFWEYFKIGLFTIGGGYAMLPMVTQVMNRYGWLSEDQLIQFIGVAESTPGPFAINVATFVGMNVGGSTSLGVLGGFLGALSATVAVVLPSLIIIIVVTRVFNKFKKSFAVNGVLYGVRPVVVGLILSSVITVTARLVFPNLRLTDITADGFADFSLASLLLILAFLPLSRIKIKGKKIHPVFLIIFSAVVGVLLFGVCGIPS